MKKRHGHISLAIFAFFITILVVGVYAYMQYVVEKSVGRAALARDIVRVEEANKVRQQEIRDLHQNTIKEREILGTMFVPANDIVGFIENVERLGTMSGGTVKIASIDADTGAVSGAGAGSGTSGARPQAKKKTSNTIAGEMSAQVEVTGPWPAVMKTLILAEDMPYATSIKKVSMVTSDSSVAVGTSSARTVRNWRLTFTLSAVLSVPAQN